jgi:hypothetical protein
LHRGELGEIAPRSEAGEAPLEQFGRKEKFASSTSFGKVQGRQLKGRTRIIIIDRIAHESLFVLGLRRAREKCVSLFWSVAGNDWFCDHQTADDEVS